MDFPNNISVDCPDPNETIDADFFAFIVDTVIVGFLCVVGMVGNVISVIAFSREKYSTTSLLLTCLAVSDFLYLAVHGLLFQCFRSIYPYTGAFKEYFDKVSYVDVWEYPLGVMFQTLSVFFVVLVAVDRYIAVCWPLHSRHWSDLRMVKIQITAAVLVGVGVNFPRFFTAKTTERYDYCTDSMITVIEKDKLGKNAVYGYVMTCVYIILIYLLPIVILLVINIRLVHAIRAGAEARRRHLGVSLSTIASSGNRITAMLCSIILVFLICQIPISVNHLQYATGNTLDPLPQRYFNILSNMLVIFNSAVNFFIYVIMGSKFRKQVKLLFTKSCRKNKRILESKRSTFTVTFSSDSRRSSTATTCSLGQDMNSSSNGKY